MWRMVWKIDKLRLGVVVWWVMVKVNRRQEWIGVAQGGRVWKREQGLVFFQVLDHLVHKIIPVGFCSFSRSSNKAPQRIVVVIAN